MGFPTVSGDSMEVAVYTLALNIAYSEGKAVGSTFVAGVSREYVKDLFAFARECVGSKPARDTPPRHAARVRNATCPVETPRPGALIGPAPGLGGERRVRGHAANEGQGPHFKFG